MEYFNAKWVTPESIDYEYEHGEFGVIPSTCASWDEASCELFARIAADLGSYVAPPPPPPEEILRGLIPVSRVQMLAALVDFEIITDAEAMGWLGGDLPAVVKSAIAALPAGAQLVATLRAKAQTPVDPSDPLVAALAVSKEMGPEAMVLLFQHAAAL